MDIDTCHPSPSNGQHEPTKCMSNVTLVVALLLTFHHMAQTGMHATNTYSNTKYLGRSALAIEMLIYHQCKCDRVSSCMVYVCLSGRDKLLCPLLYYDEC